MDREKLLKMFFVCNSLKTLTEAVSSELYCSLIVVDDAYRVVSHGSISPLYSGEYKKAVSHGELTLETAKIISDQTEQSDIGYVTFEQDGKNYRLSRLFCGDIMLGYLIYIFDKKQDTSSPEDFDFIESLLAKQLYFERGGFVQNTAEKILTDLLNGNFETEQYFNYQTKGMFLSNLNPERFAVIDVENLDMQETKIEILRKKITEFFHASHPFIYDNKIILFLFWDHELHLLNSMAKEYSLQIVISGKIKSLYSICKAYPIVKMTLVYLKDKNDKKFFCEMQSHYSELMLLKKFENNTELIDDNISMLAKHDRENGGELCLTLYNYLIAHHSLKLTCEKMFTHRNTVLYRLNKIREEFCPDIDNSEKHLRFLLSLSLVLLSQNQDELFISKTGDEF